LLVAQARRDSKRSAVTAENLVEDFGHEAEIGHGMMAVLASQLESHVKATGNNKIMLFEEWRTLLPTSRLLRPTKCGDRFPSNFHFRNIKRSRLFFSEFIATTRS